VKRHDWWATYSGGAVEWECRGCGAVHKLLLVAAADPERLRSMLVVLEARCAGTSAGRGLPGAVA
jgi:hypothetical protein